MNIIQYDLKNTLNRLNSIFEMMLHGENSDTSLSEWKPAADIREEENRFVIEADLPGVDKNDIDISMSGNILTIQGKRNEEHKESKGNYSRTERIQGRFYRQFTLPETIESDKVQAHSKKGILEIVIPKKASVKPRKIAVIESEEYA
ncbi:MAG: hspA 7 [Gammaproteobacteria bacterium]|jgi:HSP20 family protein|nr:hspA 7 [Gammaproteobacteria bacterium]